MQTELTNLLPPERREHLRKDYLYRLGTVVALVVAFLALVNIALLAPSYLYLRDQAALYKGRAAALSAARTAAGYENLASRIDVLNASAVDLIFATP